MARKKHRSLKRVPAGLSPAGTSTAVQASPTPALSANTNVQVQVHPTIPPAVTRPVERSWIEIVGIKAARWLGSLQVAVILLALFTLAVLLGTFMEHWYNTKTTQELVYKSWWFIFLLFLLAVNIFCAAVKKWPWKKHQTGFLITHVGLLTMLSGGILHGMSGTDAQMQLLDTGDPVMQNQVQEAFGRVPQASDQAIYSDVAMIRVREFAGGNPHNPHENPHATGAPKVYVGDFWGGALPWKSSENQKYDFTLGFLNWLQHPLGRSWSMDLGGKANIEVVDFLPHARREAFSPTERGFPALKIYLKGKFGMPSEPWLAGNLEDRQYSPGPALVEFLGRCPTLMVTEFLNPPALDELGKQGVLVAHVDGKMARIPVDASLGKTVSLGGGFDVKIDKFVSNWREEEGPAEDPGLEFEVYKNGKKEGTFLVLARFTGLVLDKNKKGIFPQGQRGMPTFWYHPADVRWGNDRYRGVLQFVQGDDGRLYFRSFKHQDQGFGKETSGEVSANRKENPIWGKMQFSFRVLEHLPDATKKERYFPVNLVPGKETEEDKLRYPEVILCRVSDGKDTKEIWVGKSMGARRVLVNGKTYAIEYTIKQIKLPFTIKLERAEQTVDPGTRAAASYTSFVQLFDQEKKINGERRQITMNEPLEHRGYKFYQSTYQFLDAWDANGKPVSVSGFTVGHDPGLSLKYLGSLMLGLGIACMFYMKAYFFKPRGRKAPASLPPSQPA